MATITYTLTPMTEAEVENVALKNKIAKLESQVKADKTIYDALIYQIGKMDEQIKAFKEGIDEGAFKMVEQLSEDLGIKEDKIISMEKESEACERRWEQRSTQWRRLYERADIYIQACAESDIEPHVADVLDAIDENSTDYEQTIDCIEQYLDVPQDGLYTEWGIEELYKLECLDNSDELMLEADLDDMIEYLNEISVVEGQNKYKLVNLNLCDGLHDRCEHLVADLKTRGSVCLEWCYGVGDRQ